jgi:hypothetical protein
MLEAIKAFAVRDDEDDWKRCIVCGVIWLPGSIAINTRQLRLLIDKCKSSINGSLQRMGYSSVTSRGDTSKQLIEFVPKLPGNFSELRQWTVRQISAQTPQPAAPVVIEPARKKPVSPEPACIDECEPGFSEGLKRCENDTYFFDDEFALPLVDWIETKGEERHEPPCLDDGSFFGMNLL